MTTKRCFTGLLMVLFVLAFYNCTDNNQPPPDDNLNVVPEAYKLQIPSSLQSTSRNLDLFSHDRSIADQVATNTQGQEIVVYAIQEIGEKSTQLSQFLIFAQAAIEKLESPGTDWQTNIGIIITADMIESIKALEGGELPAGFSYAEGDSYTMKNFIYAANADFDTVLASLNSGISNVNTKININTSGYDTMLIIDEISTPGTTEFGDHIGLTLFLWNTSMDKVKVYNVNQPPAGEVFKMEYNFDSILKKSDIFYFNYFYPLPESNLSTIILSLTLHEVDAAKDGIILDFIFQHILGDVGHEFQFHVQGYADNEGGYTELRRYYDTNPSAYNTGNFGRSKEQFSPAGVLTSLKGFDEQGAPDLNSWFVIPDTGEWNDADTHNSSFNTQYSFTMNSDLSKYNSYLLSGSGAIRVQLPTDLTWQANEYEKWFVLTLPDNSPLDYTNCIAFFGITQDKYITDPDHFFQCLFLRNNSGLDTSYDLHEITSDDGEALITATIKTTINLNTTTGVYK